VPSLFGPEEAVICRRLGVNVGHWNMQERALSFNGGMFFADSEPVSFLHFSGWDPDKPEVPSKYAVTSAGETEAAWAAAGRSYRALLLENGLNESRSKKYSYSVANDGTLITLEMRRALLAKAKTSDDDSLAEMFFDNPHSVLPRKSKSMARCFKNSSALLTLRKLKDHLTCEQ
jgi:hypothetical protein